MCLNRSVHQQVALGFVALFFALFSLSASPVAARPMSSGEDPSAVVGLQASSATVTGCGVTRVEIWAKNITNLYGVDVRFAFDPSVLQVVDADPVSPGTQIAPLSGFLQPDFVARKVACNIADASDPNCPTAGLVWYAATQTAPNPPVSGSGALAAIDFVGHSAGLSALKIIHSEPVDIAGRIIPASLEYSQLTVTPPTTPALTIALAPEDRTTARLAWTAIGGAGEYHLYRATSPYFTPIDPAYRVTNLQVYDDAGAVGDPNSNHYYVVKSSCSTGFASEPSNRTGEFDFRLVTP
jgi:hypothetical protein